LLTVYAMFHFNISNIISYSSNK